MTGPLQADQLRAALTANDRLTTENEQLAQEYTERREMYEALLEQYQELVSTHDGIVAERDHLLREHEMPEDAKLAELRQRVEFLLRENMQLHQGADMQMLEAVKIDRDKYRNAFVDLVYTFGKAEPHDQPAAVGKQIKDYFVSLLHAGVALLKAVDSGTIITEDFVVLRTLLDEHETPPPPEAPHAPKPPDSPNLAASIDKIRAATRASQEAAALKKTDRATSLPTR